MVERLVALGARRADIGQGEVEWTVMADPEGNEFCVVPRGEFLADRLVCSGSIVLKPADHPTVGRFWSEATGWPVVYDEDGDMANRDPGGSGPFSDGRPARVRRQDGGAIGSTSTSRHRPTATRKSRPSGWWLFGARRIDIGQADESWVVMADPQGNEFCIVPPR